VDGLRIDITRRMRTRAKRVGQERQDFHDERGTDNAYGLGGNSDHWLKINIQGAMAELVVAHAVGTEDAWVECVENYHDLKGDVVDHLQVRSTYNPNNGLILHPKDKDDDCFVLVYLDREHDHAVLRGWLWAHEGKKDEFWPGKHPERPCFTVPPRFLHPNPIPVWHGKVIYPCSNENQKERKRAKTHCAKRRPTGDLRLICPRCGWATDHLTMPYHDSPWRLFGGICGECCVEAEKYHDKKGWPEPLPPEGEVLKGKELEHALKVAFGMEKAVTKRTKKGEVGPDQTSMGFGPKPVTPEE
jgi:hypothetical protein